MGRRTGLSRCAHQAENTFLGPSADTLQRDCSEQTAREIDEEVERLLREAYAAALERLQEHRKLHHAVVTELLDKEVLDRDAFLGIVRAHSSRLQVTG
jgi:cell division protease FtsH